MYRNIQQIILHKLTSTGEFVQFVRDCFYWMFRQPFRIQVFLKRLETIGVDSLSIIVLVGTFAGMVFGLQTGYAFRTFSAESLVGSTVGIAVTRELAPVFTALMIIARAGSSMAAQIGTMQVTEQVLALQSMGVNPIQYLVVPRVLASFIMVPLLTGVFDLVGILGSYVVGVHFLGIPEGPFLYRLKLYVDLDDIFQGLIKAAVFGVVLALISCFKGYQTEGGAEGVGKSTTQAVVYSSVTVLVLDYFLSYWILEWFPQF